MAELTFDNFTQFGKKIICIGRNYRDQVAELKIDDVGTTPAVCLKPSTAFVTEGHPVKMPNDCEELLQEAELGVVIGRKGSKIPESDAMDYVAGFVVALDMVDKRQLALAKKNRLPWSLAKAFDTSCAVGSFIPKEEMPDITNLRVWCTVNGSLRQDGSTSNMRFPVPWVVSYLSSTFTLEPGDLIMTGTPAGASTVYAGDTIVAKLGEITSLTIKVQK